MSLKNTRGREKERRSDFRRQAYAALEDARRKSMGLDQFVFSKFHSRADGTKQSTEYTTLELMQSYPFLMVGLRGLQAQIKQRAGRGGAPVELEAKDDPDSVLGTTKAFLNLLEGTLKSARPACPTWSEPHVARVPKTKLVEGLSLEDMATVVRSSLEQRENHIESPTGEFRPLTISSLDQRCAAGAAARVIGAHLKQWWPSTAVGFRPGISIPKILSAFRQVVAGTGRRFVVLADIKGFFDHIPTAPLWDHIGAELGIQRQGHLGQYLELLLGGPRKKGLPQGNPLSPILANFFAAVTIDPKLSLIGPILRYADDLAVFVNSEEEANQALSSMAKVLNPIGLRLAEKKTQVIDLIRNQTRNHQGEWSGEPPVYLGAAITTGDDGLPRFHLSDSGLWSLASALVDVWTEPGSPDVRVPEERLLHCLGKADRVTRGWLQHYGGIDWSRDQQSAFVSLLNTVHLLPVANDPLDDVAKEYGRSAGELRRQVNDAAKGRSLWAAFSDLLTGDSTSDIEESELEAVLSSGLKALLSGPRARFRDTMHAKFNVSWGPGWTEATNLGGPNIVELGEVDTVDPASLPTPVGFCVDDVQGPGRDTSTKRHGAHAIIDLDEDLF